MSHLSPLSLLPDVCAGGCESACWDVCVCVWGGGGGGGRYSIPIDGARDASLV